MIRLANHVREVTHVDHGFGHGHHGVRERIERQTHLNRDVADLDRVLHEMQDTLIHLKARTVVQRPVYDRHGRGRVGVSFGRYFSINVNSHGTSHHGHGASYRAPSSLDRLEISLASLSETVHHLLEDTEVVCVGRR
jgi:hypothetical protein